METDWPSPPADIPASDFLDESSLPDVDCCEGLLDSADELPVELCSLPCQIQADCAGLFPQASPCETPVCQLVEACAEKSPDMAYQCVLELTEPPECCIADIDCADNDPCTENEGCLANYCVWSPIVSPDCCPDPVLELDFDDGVWPQPIPPVQPSGSTTWSIVDSPCHEGMALYLGDSECRTYYNGQLVDCVPVDGIPCTPETEAEDCPLPLAQCDPVTNGCKPDPPPTTIVLSLRIADVEIPNFPDVALSFDIRTDLEPPFPGSPMQFDILRLHVEPEDSFPIEVFSTKDLFNTDGLCVTAGIDLWEFAGEKVDLVWSFDTLDDTLNHFEGVYLDNMRLWSPCGECYMDAQCPNPDPGNSCSWAKCHPGQGCSFEPIPFGDNTPCGSDDPCIEDGACEDGNCVPGQFTCPHCCKDEDCQDGNPCTKEVCDGWVCLDLGVDLDDPGCCVTVQDCDDAIVCTEDLCIDFQCTNSPVSSCCSENSHCEDDNPCTCDVCAFGACYNLLESLAPPSCTFPANCCSDEGDCEDDNLCTLNTCAEGECKFEQDPEKPNCCISGTDCYDSDMCTVDTCVNYECQNKHIAGCCHPGGCTDGIECTWDHCVYDTCVHLPLGEAPPSAEFPPYCCGNDEDCDDGNPCTDDSCDPFTWDCHSVPNNCNQCSDDDPGTVDFCLEGGCIVIN